MKCLVPEISWHNRDPVLSLDIQCSCDPSLTKYDVKTYRIATGGTDGHVEIWFIKELADGTVNVECVSDLKRHNRAVNVVRFSPDGKYLASGDDESALFVWKKSDRDDDFVDVCADEEQLNRDKWVIFKTLRGHLEDIQDLCWSRDSNYLVSGSVDNTAIVWDVAKGQQVGMLSEHKGFVQGVAFDPKGQYVATLSTDRDLRIYSATGKMRVAHKVNRVSMKVLPEKISSVGESDESASKPIRLFHDDTLKTYSRRLDFSPDGEILFAPAGCLEVNMCSINVFYAFSRVNLSVPAVVYPLGPKTNALAIRCCPVLFRLRKLNNNNDEEGETDEEKRKKAQSLFSLPYRVVFAVITQDSLILYDTQSSLPFTKIANIHYTRLSDLSWSSDARLLMISSTDGFCSFVTFREGELGEVYEPEKEGATQATKKEKVGEEERMDVEVVLQKPQEEEAKKEEEPMETEIVKEKKKEEEEKAKPVENKAPFVIRARSAKHGSARKIEIITQPMNAGPEAKKCRVENATEVPNSEETEKTTPKKLTPTSQPTSPSTTSEANPSIAPLGSAQKKRVPFQTLSSPKTYKKKQTSPSKCD